MFGLTGAIVDLLRPSSQSVREEYLSQEYDEAERNATVSLYSKVVDGLTSIDGSTGGNGSAHHWALVISFEDGSYRTMEGNQNDDHFLHAYYRKERGSGLTMLKELGSVCTSPAKLRRIARDNPLNGTRYDLVSNNCQDWAIKAAHGISSSIGREAASIPRIAPVLRVTRDVTTSVLLPGNPVNILMGFRR